MSTEQYQLRLTKTSLEPGGVALELVHVDGDCGEHEEPIVARWLNSTWWQRRGTNHMLVAMPTRPLQWGQKVPCEVCVRPVMDAVVPPSFSSDCCLPAEDPLRVPRAWRVGLVGFGGRVLVGGCLWVIEGEYDDSCTPGAQAGQNVVNGAWVPGLVSGISNVPWPVCGFNTPFCALWHREQVTGSKTVSGNQVDIKSLVRVLLKVEQCTFTLIATLQVPNLGLGGCAQQFEVAAAYTTSREFNSGIVTSQDVLEWLLEITTLDRCFAIGPSSQTCLDGPDIPASISLQAIA